MCKILASCALLMCVRFQPHCDLVIGVRFQSHCDFVFTFFIISYYIDIVESGVKHHNPNPKKMTCLVVFVCIYDLCKLYCDTLMIIELYKH